MAKLEAELRGSEEGGRLFFMCLTLLGPSIKDVWGSQNPDLTGRGEGEGTSKIELRFMRICIAYCIYKK